MVVVRAQWNNVNTARRQALSEATLHASCSDVDGQVVDWLPAWE